MKWRHPIDLSVGWVMGASREPLQHWLWQSEGVIIIKHPTDNINTGASVVIVFL